MYEQLNLFDLPPQNDGNYRLRHPDRKKAAKLRALADSMQPAINAKLHPAIAQHNLTPRRQRIIDSMRCEAQDMQQIQRWLRGMATAAEMGELPRILERVASKAQLEILHKLKYWQPADIERVFSSAAYDSWVRQLQRASLHSPGRIHKAIAALCSLDAGVRAEEALAETILELEAQALFANIPDYFPTPISLAEKLVVLGSLKPGMRVLEPSAGNGAIAQVIRERCPTVRLQVCEADSTLRRVLELKGFEVIGADFIRLENEWDCIIANPPFSDFMAHTYHAYRCLAPGGRLLTVAPESIFFQRYKNFQEFRAWMRSLNAWDEKLPEGAFLKSKRPTAVKTRVVKIEKH
jgi:Methyltransferase small domain